MKIPENVLEFAKQDGLPQVVYFGQWNRFDVYVASDPEAPYIGPPQVILLQDGKPRWATLEETDSITL